MVLLVRSPFGLTLRGIRENEPRMRSLGFNTWLHCYLSYVISGAFASVAGVMWAYYNGFVSPTYLDLTASSELFLMVTLGGPATLVGPVLGAGAIVLLKNVMSAYTARWLLILGIVYIVDDPVGAAGAVESREAKSLMDRSDRSRYVLLRSSLLAIACSRRAVLVFAAASGTAPRRRSRSASWCRSRAATRRTAATS